MGRDEPTPEGISASEVVSSRLHVSLTSTTPSSVYTGRLFTIEARTKFDADFDGTAERVTVTLTFTVDN